VTAPDREQLRRDCSDALAAIQRDCDVTGLDVLAVRLQETEHAPLPFHGRLILKELAPVPRNYSALIWHLVQVVAKLERSWPC
jgi:hypothetical protein